jgi:hypothetical protein
MNKSIFYFLIIFSLNLTAQTTININHKSSGSPHGIDENTGFTEQIHKNNISAQKTIISNAFSNDKDYVLSEVKYNHSGKPGEKIMYGNDGKILSRQVRIYDTKGNLTGINNFDKGNNFSGGIVKKYNENSQLIEDYETDKNGKKSGKNETDYDNNGRMNEIQGYSAENVLVIIKTFKYDISGNMISKTSMDGSGKKLNVESYKYDNKGNKTEIEINNIDNKYKYKYKFNFDNENNLTLMQRIYGDTEIIETYTYKYDNNRNNIESEYISKGTVHTVLASKFDENNNKVEQILKLWDGSLSSKTTWEYNSTGVVTGEKQWNVQNGQVSQETKYFYEYFK